MILSLHRFHQPSQRGQRDLNAVGQLKSKCPSRQREPRGLIAQQCACCLHDTGRVEFGRDCDIGVDAALYALMLILCNGNGDARAAAGNRLQQR